MRNGFVVLGTTTLTSGVLGVGSGQTSTANAVNITTTDTTSALLRVSGNTGNSTLNIGSGGITASGGEIQLKFNTTNFDAILNLGGNFTTTGNVLITNAGYTGPNLNVINLTASRIFNIGASTLTTVAPDIAGPGGLTKSGNGTLTLTSLVAGTYTGETIINAGTLLVHGTLTGTTKVDVSGTLGGTGTITPASAGNVNILAGGILSPGASVGTLSVVLSGGGILDISGGALATNSHSLAFEINTPGASDSVNITGGALRIGTGVLEFNDFNFTSLGGITGDTDYILFAGDTAIDGTLGATYSGTLAGFPAELRFADGGTDLILHVPEPTATLSLLTGLGTLLARRRRRK